MLVDAKVQRIGGSTFVRLPPTVVKNLGLHDGDTVQLNILREGKTLGEVLQWFKDHPLTDEEKRNLQGWKEGRGFSKYD